MATFTPQEIIDEVRRAVQDTSTSQPRYSDTHMLGVVNQVLRRIALLRPDLFAHITTMPCVAGTIQTAPADSIRIIDILVTDSGNNVQEVNRETLDLMFTTWQNLPAGPAQDWMRHPRNPNQFFIYPKQAGTEVLTIEYAQSPPKYTLTQPVALIADAYFPVVVDGCVWLLESVDNESVGNGRAKMFQDAFMQGLGLTVQTKRVTDTDSGGEDPKELA